MESTVSVYQFRSSDRCLLPTAASRPILSSILCSRPINPIISVNNILMTIEIVSVWVYCSIFICFGFHYTKNQIKTNGSILKYLLRKIHTVIVSEPDKPDLFLVHKWFATNRREKVRFCEVLFELKYGRSWDKLTCSSSFNSSIDKTID